MILWGNIFPFRFQILGIPQLGNSHKMAGMSSLCEVTHSMTPRVDREAGIIHGVKVLGRESKNGRTYSDRALSEAAKLYEKRDVNLNHPPSGKGNAERHVEDMFGWLESVNVQPDGVYADLHYATSHPMAPAIVEIAQKNPMRLGLSHNAEGTVKRKDGRNVVESIESVKSVDLVQTPATVAGLFESERKPSKTCRQILEDYTGETLPPVPGMDEPAEVMPTEEPDEAGEAAKAALAQVFAAALSAGGDLKSILAKVVDLASSMMGAMPEEPPEETDDTEEQPDPAEAETPVVAEETDPMTRRTPPMAESNKTTTVDPNVVKLTESLARLEARLDQQERRAAAVALLESHNVDPTETRIGAVAAVADEAGRVALVEAFPQRERAPRGDRPVVRPLREAASAAKYPDNLSSFVASIR